jgi:hypothetical protein
MEHVVCLSISASYVCSLYLIPSSIRALPRDHLTHVRLVAPVSFSSPVGQISDHCLWIVHSTIRWGHLCSWISGERSVDVALHTK